MTPWYDDGQAKFWLGDCREVLRSLPDESVQCVVTSPPYWSLRDYGVEPSVWGGGVDGYGSPCITHEWGDVVEQQRGGAYTGKTRWQHIAGEAQEDGVPVRTVSPEAWGLVDGHPKVASGQFCAKCGAWRGALGLEPTPELFVAHTVEVFREVRRVLAKDGTLWLNLGDSYAGSWGAQGRQGANGQMADRSVVQARSIDAHPQRISGTGSTANMPGIKPKDLVGIPWMVVFALRADGWWLRQDIIWAKPNPMPESVRDRCTKAHEYLFLLSKAERYYYDADAIAEAVSDNTNPRTSQANIARIKALREDGANTTAAGIDVSPKSAPAGSGIKANESYHHAMALPVEARNKRSVWTVATAPFPEAHFATFPPDLVKPCILAGCPEGGVVLDPFIGSGTTAMVAKALGRKAWGIDAKAEYLEMAKRRCAQMGLQFGDSVIPEVVNSEAAP